MPLGDNIQNKKLFLSVAQFKNLESYSDVSIKNIDILPNRQYIANIADSAQEQYS